jgi:hypothetical protein
LLEGIERSFSQRDLWRTDHVERWISDDAEALTLQAVEFQELAIVRRRLASTGLSRRIVRVNASQQSDRPFRGDVLLHFASFVV